jgi:N-acetylmuramoyl-L-alanine amidase
MSQFHPDSSVVERVEASPNFDERAGLARPDMVILHYTGMQVAHEAVHRLCDPKARVSSHYVVMEKGSILQLVPEAKRAWHAGVSSWGGDTDINSRSIGIEIGNQGHDFGCPDFPDPQIAAVIGLCRDIISRTSIAAHHVLAHSDVAPDRKRDPGEGFPWRRLAEGGVGLWVEPEPIVDGAALRPGDRGEEVADLQRALADYGYGVAISGSYEATTEIVVTAFQRHFRPARVDGVADASTVRTLKRLIAKRDSMA